MTRFVSLVVVAVAWVALGPVRASAAPITFYSTGQGGPGSIDAHYDLIQAPPGVALGAVIIDPNKIAKPWAAPAAGASWIGVTDDDARNGNGAMAPSDPGHLDAGHGLYVFRTSFDLSGYEAASFAMQGQWAVDNLGEIRVNGGSTGIFASGYGLQSFLIDSSNASLLAGINTLDFYVTNRMSIQDIGNPVGLLVQGLNASVDLQATPVPEPGSFLLLGTALLVGSRRLLRRRPTR